MKSGVYIYKCFTFESLKLHNGLSNQLPISNTSCNTTSLYENRFWCLTLAPCRRYKAQYPRGVQNPGSSLQECPNHFKIDMHAKESVTIDFCRSLIFTSSVMEIQECKVSPRFPLESRLSQSLNRFHSPEWD